MNKTTTWAAMTVILAGLLVGPARWALPATTAAALAKAPAPKASPGKAPARKALRPAELLRLANSLHAGDTATRQVRLKLIETIAAQYLSDAKATRRISIEHWRQLVTALRGDLAPKFRGAWAAQLRLAFSGDNNAVKAMKLRDIACLVATAHMLGDKLAPQLMFTWLKLQGPESVVASIGSMRAAAAMLMQADRGVARRLMKESHKILAARHAKTPLTSQQCNQFRQACLDVGCVTEAQQWGMRVYQATLGTEAQRASAGAASLASLSNMLIETDMVGQGKEYPEFAIVLARLIRQGKLAKSGAAAQSLGAPLGTDRTRKMVQAGLLNAKGALQMGVAEVLAWAYKTSGQLKVWDEYLDWKARDKKVPADTRAMWLVARAYSATIRRDPPEPRLGKRWLTAALAAAKSQPTRFSIAQRLVDYYRGKNRPELAIGLMDSIKKQFTGDTQMKLDALRAKVQGERAARQEEVAVAQRKAGEARRQATLAYYRRQLALAKKMNEPKKVAKLEAAIKRVEGEQK